MVTHESNIPYEEYRAIAQLLRAHVDEHKGKLRAMVAFGELVTGGDTYDIDLPEVVEDWKGSHYFEFGSTADLPLRGKLRLYFLRPEELVDPSRTEPKKDIPWTRALLERVREGYQILVEIPAGSISRILNP